MRSDEPRARNLINWRRGQILAVGVALAVGLPATTGWAAEVYRGDRFTANIDTTLSIGTGFRTQERDSDLIYGGNDPGNPAGQSDAFYSNSDDGNLNYDQFDVYSANAKVTFDVELDYAINSGGMRNLGVFVRANAFYDVIGNCEQCTRRTDLSADARHRASVIDGGVVGTQFLFLDAYADADFDVLDRFLNLRFGNQVLSWGESLFIQGGINTINAIDVAKIRTPGAELREALAPAPMIRVAADLLPNLGIEGYYQFWWNRTHVDPAGSFFATSDLMGRGADQLYFFNDAGSSCPGLAPPGPLPPTCQGYVIGIDKLSDNDPSSQGQGGVALRYYWDRIATEFGLYYVRYHNKTPSGGQTAAWLGPLVGGQPAPTGYFRDYAEGIDLVGGSFATELFGATVAGEMSYRPNDQTPIVATGLALAEVVANAGVGDITSVVAQDGYVREKRLQAQWSTTASFSQSTRLGVGYVVEFLRAADIQLIGEMGMTWYPDLATQCESPRSSPFLAPPGCVPYSGVGSSDSTVDDLAWTYQLLARFNYQNPLGVPITLTPSVGWLHDFSGSSPNVFYIEGRKAVTVGLELDYQKVWGFKTSYANFFGAGDQNLSSDRDFFSMTLSYAF